MEKLKMIKAVGGLIVSIGVGSIVGSAIKSTNPTESAGALKKLCVGIGGMVLSSMICDKAVAFTEEKIDKGITEIKKAVDEANEAV